MPRSSPVLVASFAVLFGAPSFAQTATAPARDYKQIANRVVNDVVHVKHEDLVFVFGEVRDLPLLDELQAECWKLGAQTLPVYSSERMTRRFFDESPAKFDSDPPDLWLKLTPLATVLISVDGQEHPELWKDVPPERSAAMDKAWEPVAKLRLERNVRRVSLGNGLYPTAATAKSFGITKEELEKLFFDGIGADPKKLHATGVALRDLLAKGKELRIKNANGTDLKMRVEGRAVVLNDGAISDEDLKKGGPALIKWLPAGEVLGTPVTGTAEGKVVIDRLPWDEGEVEALTLTVKAGKITAMTAKPSPYFDHLKKQYEAAIGRKDELSVFDFGINPDVKFPKTGKPLTWIPAGSFTLQTGGNTQFGGDNTCMFGVALYLPGSTVTLDGKPIVDKGELKVVAK